MKLGYVKTTRTARQKFPAFVVPLACKVSYYLHNEKHGKSMKLGCVKSDRPDKTKVINFFTPFLLKLCSHCRVKAWNYNTPKTSHFYTTKASLLLLLLIWRYNQYLVWSLHFCLSLARFGQTGAPRARLSLLTPSAHLDLGLPCRLVPCGFAMKIAFWCGSSGLLIM
jgi:hypothetical protein